MAPVRRSFAAEPGNCFFFGALCRCPAVPCCCEAKWLPQKHAVTSCHAAHIFHQFPSQLQRNSILWRKCKPSKMRYIMLFTWEERFNFFFFFFTLILPDNSLCKLTCKHKSRRNYCHPTVLQYKNTDSKRVTFLNKEQQLNSVIEKSNISLHHSRLRDGIAMTLTLKGRFFYSQWTKTMITNVTYVTHFFLGLSREKFSKAADVT